MQKEEQKMREENILRGLKRASWFFALLSSLIAATIYSEAFEDWYHLEYYLPPTIIAGIVAFLVFRIGIWVVKGFFGREDEISDS